MRDQVALVVAVVGDAHWPDRTPCRRVGARRRGGGAAVADVVKARTALPADR